MSWLMLSDVARMLAAEMHGPDVALDHVSIDTRRVDAGALFFALRGPNFDAHDVLDREAERPLAGLVVGRPVRHPASYVLVDDTREALGRLAAAWRQRLDLRVIGLTGSNGKTTVKEMIASICASQGKTLATLGNLNNEIGVPLTLLRLRPEHDYAVIEMGANHVGEIAGLTALVKPDVALLINAAGAHLEGFGSIERVADAKGEIFTGLGTGGIAIINADSPFAERWKTLNQGRRQILFGKASDAHCRVVDASACVLDLHGEQIVLQLQLMGRHNVFNAAAAAAAAMALGVDAAAVARGLAAVEPVAGRLHKLAGPRGSTLIDDSYNANPASMRAAIEVLAEQRGRRYLVFGDMAELGTEAAAMHAEIGAAARMAGLDGLLTLGPLSARAVQAFGKGAEAFDDLEALVEALHPLLGDAVTVLVKGSRSAAMEHVITALSGVDGNGDRGGKSHAA